VSRLRIAGVAVAAAFAVACLVVLGWTVDALIGAAGCAVLVAVTVTDIERRIVPNRIVVPALVAALVARTLADPSVEWILAALGAGGFFFVAALAYPAGLGMGDVKLAAFMGAWLGSAVVVALFAGSLLAMFPAVYLLATRGAAARKTALPFAPFLAAGGAIALFVGDAVLDWWLG
jgi:prepilin signal peptidase PulO-like enzyme (type II secretory pathway)